MSYKLELKRPLNATQILQGQRLFEYLCPAGKTGSLSPSDLAMTIKVLGLIPPADLSNNAYLRPPNRAQAGFARAVLAYMTSQAPTGGWEAEPADPVAVINMLCQSGETDEALRLTMEWPWTSTDRRPDVVHRFPLYLHSLGHEKKLLQLLNLLKENAMDVTIMWRHMAIFYARLNRVDETLSCTKAAAALAPIGTWGRSFIEELVLFAARNGQQDWMNRILAEIDVAEPNKRFWVSTVCRHLLLDGSWEDTKAAMERSADHNLPSRANVARLLEIAVERSDEELANEITAFAAKRGLAPDANIYLQWLKLKIDKEQLEGAKFSYERYRDAAGFSTEKPRAWAKYQVAVNRFLCLLCSQKTPDFAYITQVLEHADEAQVFLEAGTIARLSLRFLENEQYLDAMDLLAIHAFKLGESERQTVQLAFKSFCQDPNISTGRAWSAYQVLEQYFPDLEREERVDLMEEFFRRKRPDMALGVFSAMRNHRSPAYRPDESMYRQCFEGFARNPDLESTERVHDWLKTDQTISPSTRLFTALMLAYTAAERPLIALDFWKEITTCKEGPGYGSLSAVFWALEKRPTGAKMAREIWSRIETMDIEVPAYVYNSYVGAIAASGQMLEVQKVINNMASYIGTPPEPLT